MRGGLLHAEKAQLMDGCATSEIARQVPLRTANPYAGTLRTVRTLMCGLALLPVSDRYQEYPGGGSKGKEREGKANNVLSHAGVSQRRVHALS